MAKTTTWQAKCKRCDSPVYYYPAKLLIESITFKDVPKDTRKRLVDCTCTGEATKEKHTSIYSFPDDFKEV